MTTQLTEPPLAREYRQMSEATVHENLAGPAVRGRRAWDFSALALLITIELAWLGCLAYLACSLIAGG